MSQVVGVFFSKANIQFSYKDKYTEVNQFEISKLIYRFDDHFQLTAIEQYLDNALYRVHKKSWDGSNLISTSIEDGDGHLFYHKQFIYNDENDLIKEEEYGDLSALNVDGDGSILHSKPRVQSYSHFSWNSPIQIS